MMGEYRAVRRNPRRSQSRCCRSPVVVAVAMVAVSACSGSGHAEPARFSQLPAPCFSGLQEDLKELAGPLYELGHVLHNQEPEALQSVGRKQTCGVEYWDDKFTLKGDGNPYRRVVTVFYTLYLDTPGSDPVSWAADRFRNDPTRPSTASSSASLRIGDDFAVSWPGEGALSPGWHVQFRASNMVVEVAVDGDDYEPDTAVPGGFKPTRTWEGIPGQLREPTERFALAVSQH